jgi:hypothetical protein
MGRFKHTEQIPNFINISPGLGALRMDSEAKTRTRRSRESAEAENGPQEGKHWARRQS